MRDKKRIKKLLKIIEEKWNEAPDLRFGQLLINLGLIEDTLNIWNLEDDVIIKHLEKFECWLN